MFRLLLFGIRINFHFLFKKRNYSALLFFLLSFFYSSSSLAQLWKALPLNFSTPPYCFYYDSTAANLYIGGGFSYVDSIPVNQVIIYDGVSWNPVSMPSQLYPVKTICKFQNNICIGGGGGLSCWNGVQWEEISSGLINTFYLNGNELYVGGLFNEIGGDSLVGLASWNGISWSEVHGLQSYFYGTSNSISKIIEFNGDLYIAGNIDGLGPMKEIMKWNGFNWSDVGGGISGGGSAWINDMEVFNGELYIGGYFFESNGSPGNNIAKWNGSSWNSVGEGVGFGQVSDFQIFNNKLYVSGQFMEAGGIPANRIAYWDGSNWCSFTGADDNAIGKMTIFQDTLHLAGGFKVMDGDSIRFIAKWTGGNYVDTCSAPVAISNPLHSSPVPELNLSPNPSSGIFNLSFSSSKPGHTILEIFSTLGVLQKRIPISYHAGENNSELNLEGLANGMYLLKFESEGIIFTGKVVVE